MEPYVKKRGGGHPSVSGAPTTRCPHAEPSSLTEGFHPDGPAAPPILVLKELNISKTTNNDDSCDRQSQQAQSHATTLCRG